MIMRTQGVIQGPVKIGFFTLKENFGMGYKHRMNPETVSALEGYLRTRFGNAVVLRHFDHYYLSNISPHLQEQFDIVGINANWRGISPVVDALTNWPLANMARGHIFIEGSFINSLEAGRQVVAQHLRNTGVRANIVFGEVEPAVEGLIENLVSGRPISTIPNLMLSQTNWVDPVRIERTDLSKILVQPYQYLAQLLAFPLHTFHAQTSRGCGFSACTFCTDAKIWGKGWRGYPTENIATLFNDLRTQNVDYVLLFDKDFWGGNIERAQEIAKVLIEMGNTVPFTVALRADEIINGEKILELFKRAGLAFVFLGAETFSEKIARRYRKGVSVEQTLQAKTIFRAHKIDFGLGYIIDPLATLEDLLENFAVIEKHALWANISSIFNAMEVRSGIRYEEWLRSAGLLGERDEENLVYQFTYQDPRVARVVEVSREWLGEVPHINVFLIVAKRMIHRVPGRDRNDYLKYARCLSSLRRIDFNFVYSLARMIQKKREGEIPALKSEMAARYNRVKQKLLATLDPNKPIEKSLSILLK